MKNFSTPIDLNRDAFMRQLIVALSHLNEHTTGSESAGMYIKSIGLSMGAAIEYEYKKFWGIDRPFTVDEYAHVIVDLKQHIHGNFFLIYKDEEKVIVKTTSCPFDEIVRESPALCFMTSSVFGGIAARNFGYAKSVLHKRIALGDTINVDGENVPGCHVTVYLQETEEAKAARGQEYTLNMSLPFYNPVEQLLAVQQATSISGKSAQAEKREAEKKLYGEKELLSIVSHELRSAITAIIGISQSMGRMTQQGDVPSATALSKRLQIIQREADRLVLLSKDLGKIANLSYVDYAPLPRKTLDLNDFVSAAVEHQKVLANALTVTWDVQLSSDPLQVYINDARISRVLTTFLEDMLEHSPPGTTMAIRTAKADTMARLIISSQNSDISKDEVKPVLDAAAIDVQHTDSQQYSGIGLDFYLCKTILEAHGGILQFDNKQGLEATITIELPLVR